MTQTFKPFWIFFPFTILFSYLFFSRGQSEAMLAGAVYSMIPGFRLEMHLSPKKAFPVFMLLLFLLILGVSPVRGFSSTILYTVELLLVLRCLLLLLSEIQSVKSKLGRPQIALCVGFLVDVVLLMPLLIAAFKGEPTALSQFAQGIHLPVLALISTLFTPLGLIGVPLAGLSLIPALHWVPGWNLIALGFIEIGYRIKKSQTKEPQ